MKLCANGQPITFVEHSSPAERKGIRAGDVLLRINDTPVLDLIDYEKLTAERVLKINLLRENTPLEIVLHKDEYEPLGLCFETTLMSRMQTCKNHCIFCFIDQMPKGVRSSLKVKDDDWRMSFIMGNYVTLTNVDDDEFRRIIERRVSPLYVSVHATDPKVRTMIMRNPSAGRLMERLSALKDAGLSVSELVGNSAAAKKIDVRRYITNDVGEPTLKDIVNELVKPGRDPRATFEPPKFRDDVTKIEDVKEGMKLEGVVTNVTAFGAFVDIGVHQDGLVHLSELSDNFVSDPASVVKAGDRLQVTVIGVDRARGRISLSAKSKPTIGGAATPGAPRAKHEPRTSFGPSSGSGGFSCNPFANL